MLRRPRTFGTFFALLNLACIPALFAGHAAHAAPQRDFADVSKGYQKIQTAPGEGSLFGLWLDRKDNQLLAEFPRGWDKKKFLIAVTPSQGAIFAGLQGPGDLAPPCFPKEDDPRDEAKSEDHENGLPIVVFVVVRHCSSGWVGGIG